MQGLSVLSDCCPDGISGENILKKLLSRQLSDKSFEAHIAEIAENPGQSKRTDPVNAEHMFQRGSVVGKKHRPAFAGPPPQASLAIRELPITNIHTHVSVQQLEAANGGDRECRSIRPCICSVEEIEFCLRRSRSRGCRLVLSANIDNERTRCRPARRPSHGIKALFVWPTVVVEDGLA